jgi:hypothetical protein
VSGWCPGTRGSRPARSTSPRSTGAPGGKDWAVGSQCQRVRVVARGRSPREDGAVGIEGHRICGQDVFPLRRLRAGNLVVSMLWLPAGAGRDVHVQPFAASPGAGVQGVGNCALSSDELPFIASVTVPSRMPSWHARVRHVVVLPSAPLANGQQLTTRALGEGLGADRRVCDAQLLARVDTATLAPQPLAIDG